MKNKVDLSLYSNYWYQAGGSLLKRILWYYINVLIFKSSLLPVSGIKCIILRLFGAKIGQNVTLKPNINIKYPWNLFVGDNVWIGENVWIDNLGAVTIGNNVCISQEAYLLCGNHDYSKSTFDLIIKPIKIHDGAWVGAKSVICPGVIMNEHSVLTVGSVATNNLGPYSIYQGNPAKEIKTRIIY